MKEDFIIDNFDWHVRKVRNYELDLNIVKKYFRSLFVFLDENGLSTHNLTESLLNLKDDNLELRRSDLNDVGLILMQKAHGKWVDSIFDKGKSPEDTRYLAKQLDKIKPKK